MEGLAPPLKLILFIRLEIENGTSVRLGLSRYLDSYPDEELTLLLEHWLSQRETCGAKGLRQNRGWTVWRQSLIELLERGLVGESILESLKALEEEVSSAAMDQIETQINSLPFHALIPVLCFQFPSYMMLLLGPLLQDLLRGLD